MTSALAVALPAELTWLTSRVEELARQTAYLRQNQDPAQVAELGSTRAWGLPDVPLEAAWARAGGAGGSANESERFAFQLDLQEVPLDVRQPHWPQQGVVWVFLTIEDPEKGWQARTHFDPRARKDIPWLPRPAGKAPRAATWTVRPTLPDGTDKTLPEIAHTWRAGCGGLVGQYTDWVLDHFGPPPGCDFQVGGWTWPCQGDFDEHNQDFVCILMRQPWGDNTEVSLHYDQEKGFYARVDSH